LDYIKGALYCAAKYILLFIMIGVVFAPGRLVNFYKPHRWLRVEAMRHGQPEGFGLGIQIPPNNPQEVALFDICLEHGEMKRIK